MKYRNVICRINHNLLKIAGAILFVCCLGGEEVYAKSAPGNKALARQLAAECMVLLKNDRQTLPLQKGDRVAVFGEGQIRFIKGGWGSGDVNVERVVNVLEALQDKEKESFLKLAPSTAAAYLADPKLTLTPTMVQQARKEADKALIILSRNSGEGKDRSPGAGDYCLSKEEESMLQLVCGGGFERVIVVLNVGGVIDCSWLKKYPVDALLNAWQPGMEGGNAIADVLTGAVNPSGKLTSTWAAKWEDYPSSRTFFASREYVPYEEDIFVGYRYFETFDPEGKKVIFPFGFGLSYTTFAIVPVKSQLQDGTIRISVKVTNTGKYEGKEVVQLYYSAPQGKLGRPARELGAFAKTGNLVPGAAEILTLTLPVSGMAAYDDTGVTGKKSCWVLEPGDYTIRIGTSVRDLAAEPVLTVSQKELQVIQQLSPRAVPEKLTRYLTADGTYRTLQCKTDLLVKEAFPVKATGLTRIEAELHRQKNGVLRLENFVDDYGSGTCVAHMDRKGTWISFPLEVEKAGKYTIRFRAANGSPPRKDILDLQINGKSVPIRLDMPQTGQGKKKNEWYNFIELPFPIELPAGAVELKLSSKGSFANIDSFAIAPQQEADALFAAEDAAKKARKDQLQKIQKEFRKRPDGVKKVMFPEVAANPALMDDFLAQLSLQDLADLAGGSRALIAGGTGRIGALEDFGSPGVETCDGPAGVRLREKTTAWPCSTALASSWDTALAERFGEALAAEALLNGADIWLAPGMNIHRNPMCGRNFEYYSEDPVLSGKIAAAVTRSVQKSGVGITIKHYAANNKEDYRTFSDSRLTERALREIYLKGFEIAIKESDPWCVMSSYNYINGTETAESADLLHGILRQEWGYRGLVISDWNNNSNHALEILAGNNVKMPRGGQKWILHNLQSGKITRKQLEDNARYALELVLRSNVLSRKASPPPAK